MIGENGVVSPDLDMWHSANKILTSDRFFFISLTLVLSISNLFSLFHLENGKEKVKRERIGVFGV